MKKILFTLISFSVLYNECLAVVIRYRSHNSGSSGTIFFIVIVIGIISLIIHISKANKESRESRETSNRMTNFIINGYLEQDKNLDVFREIGLEGMNIKCKKKDAVIEKDIELFGYETKTYYEYNGFCMLCNIKIVFKDGKRNIKKLIPKFESLLDGRKKDENEYWYYLSSPDRDIMKGIGISIYKMGENKDLTVNIKIC